MTEAQLAPPIKTYEVVRTSTFSFRKLEICHNGAAFVWADLEIKFMKSPVLYMRTDSAGGPIIAAGKLSAWSSGVDIVMGDPNAQAARPIIVDRESALHGTYGFPGPNAGQKYQWRRTHNKELGSSRLSNSDFKLVDASNDNKILAVYIKDSFFGGKGVAHIDFMVELGNKLELLAITSILGIEERLRRRRNNNSGISGVGAGAGATAVAV